jgi:putative transcriptional regulator
MMSKPIESPKKKGVSLKQTRQKKDKHSDILAVVHETAKGLYDSGLMSMATMRDFDSMCLPTVRDLTPREIKQIRLKEKLSQPVFAEYLNASASTIKKWETGEKHPTGPTLKLLNLVAEKGLSILT